MEISDWPLLMRVHVLKLQVLRAESVPGRLSVINTVMLKSFGKSSVKCTHLGIYSYHVNLREVVANHQEDDPTR